MNWKEGDAREDLHQFGLEKIFPTLNNNRKRNVYWRTNERGGCVCVCVCVVVVVGGGGRGERVFSS